MASDRVIRLSEPVLGEEEKSALAEVIDSEWITTGPRVAEFEKAFAGLHGQSDAVAVSSCTAGLHLALAALGVGPGDEVLLPAMTFVATANAVVYVGAKPVFVDIEGLTAPHASLEDAARRCTSRCRAAIVMHYGGYPVDVAAWRAFADERGLALVEDAAHAPGVETVGRWGDLSVFSFFGNKNMVTAEGGMVLAREPELLERVRLLRSHGMTSTTLDRDRGHAHAYDVVALGYNYRLDELRAAIGLRQLDRLGEWNERRRRLAHLYRRLLGAALPEVGVACEPSQATAAHLLAAILPPAADRAAVMTGLRQRGVQSSVHYPAVHRFSYYRHLAPDLSLPVTEEFSRRELSLPLHPRLTEADVATVARSLETCLAASLG